MNSLLQTAQQWALEHGLRILIIIFVAWLLTTLLKKAVSRFEQRFGDGPASEKVKRIKTLSAIISTAIKVTVYTSATIMVVAECGVAIGPLLAGAGIAGLAIGFGAQSLVKDVISGFFIILEDQIRVGDVVNIAGAGGMVESVNLRTIRLRDVEGRVHIVPNGLIEVATNFTREWSRALVEIGVDYKEDVDRVIGVLREVGEGMRSDPDFKDLILEPMTVQGLDSFGDSSVNIRIFFKTLPIKQWDVAREFRKRIKKAFDEHGISIPFPHRTVFLESTAPKVPPPAGHLPL
ncbi:MAG: mechanosensitive ion channel family protein [Deltaproteobacteria bacterium]|nr:mechanosensitive ion channel family protein [Deltaproteobacteria bacterium]